MQAHRVVPLLLAAACADTTGPDGTRPVVVSASVARDSGNVLAAAVPVRARYADSVAVRFRRAGDAIGQTTPAVAVHGDSARIAVYGLYASNRHAIEVLAWGPGGEAEVFALEHTTDALPADLPSYDAGGPDPSPGYVVFAAGRYGIALDNAGRVVWYRHFPDGVGLNFMAQPNGRYAARPPSSDRADDGAWVEIDPSGAITRTLGCARGLAPRPHDLIAVIAPLPMLPSAIPAVVVPDAWTGVDPFPNMLGVAVTKRATVKVIAPTVEMTAAVKKAETQVYVVGGIETGRIIVVPRRRGVDDGRWRGGLSEPFGRLAGDDLPGTIRLPTSGAVTLLLPAADVNGGDEFPA
jgi:hypothetical protein